MKTLALLFFALTASAISVCAQSPVADPDTLKTVNRNDNAPDALPPDASYTEDKVKITSAELPKEVKKTLEAGSEFSGWERGQVYKDKAGKVFVIEMREADTLRTFRFDKTGKLILD